MFRYLLIICLPLVILPGCWATTPETAGSEISAAEELEQDNEVDHEDEHDEGADHGDEDSRREHGAHEHGAAELLIAWSGSELAIDLQTPAYNLLGFEHAPTSDAERAQLDESLATLREGALLELTPDAGCALVSAAVSTGPVDEEGDAEDDDHAGEQERHSDIGVAYNIHCAQPDNIDALDASELFTRFPNFETLRVQWVSDAGQSATILTPDDPVLSLDNG